MLNSLTPIGRAVNRVQPHTRRAVHHSLRTRDSIEPRRESLINDTLQHPHYPTQRNSITVLYTKPCGIYTAAIANELYAPPVRQTESPPLARIPN